MNSVFWSSSWLLLFPYADAIQTRPQDLHPVARNTTADGLQDILADLQDLPFATDLPQILQDYTMIKQTQNQEGENDANALGNATMKRKKPLLWVHVHKAGGTFMCLMAQLAGESIVQPNANCNWVNHDSYGDSGQSDHAVSCEDRKAYFGQYSYTWGAIERELWEQDKCWDDFEYGVMLREPLALMRSMMNYHPDKGKRFVESLRNEFNGTNPVQATSSQDWMWKFMDNFHVRVLASAMGEPVGTIGPSHVEKATEVLKKFCAIGRLEDLPSQGEKLFGQLGWPADMSDHISSRENPSGSAIDFTPEEEQWLREVNKHDYDLYSMYSS